MDGRGQKMIEDDSLMEMQTARGRVMLKGYYTMLWGGFGGEFEDAKGKWRES